MRNAGNPHVVGARPIASQADGMNRPGNPGAIHALQELGGWESADMVRRYAHLAPDHLAEFAERLSRPRAVSGTNLAHDEGGKEVRER